MSETPQKFGMGARPAPGHEWMLGKTAAAIDFVNEAEAWLKANNFDQGIEESVMVWELLYKAQDEVRRGEIVVHDSWTVAQFIVEVLKAPRAGEETCDHTYRKTRLVKNCFPPAPDESWREGKSMFAQGVVFQLLGMQPQSNVPEYRARVQREIDGIKDGSVAMDTRVQYDAMMARIHIKIDKKGG